MPGHYLNQCWLIVNCNLRNKFQWSINWNSHSFIQENAFENIVCEMGAILPRGRWVNTLRPRQNGRYFADDIFKCIFLNENVWISLQISLKFVPKGSINNIPSLFQIMAWGWPGNKPLSEPMMVSLPTHIWVTRPQWVKVSSPSPTHLVLVWSFVFPSQSFCLRFHFLTGIPLSRFGCKQNLIYFFLRYQFSQFSGLLD